MKFDLGSRHLILAAVLTLLALFGTHAVAADEEPTPRIKVHGEGSVSVAPDLAILDLTVLREGKTARAALDANSAAMNDVLEAMKAFGIAERDLQTSSFSIQPKYSYPAPQTQGERKPRRIVGYVVRNSLTVRSRDMSKVGEILDKSVSLGVNEGGSIRFANDDPSEALEQARIEAVKRAVAKAQTLAGAANVRVGELLELSEQLHSPRPMPMARAEMSMAMAADAVPVAEGENTYKVRVNAIFAIEQ